MNQELGLKEQLQILGIAGPAYTVVLALMALRTTIKPIDSAVSLLDASIETLELNLPASLQSTIDALRDKNFSPSEIRELKKIVSSVAAQYENYIHIVLRDNEEMKKVLGEVLRREDWIVQIFDHGLDELKREINIAFTEEDFYLANPDNSNRIILAEFDQVVPTDNNPGLYWTYKLRDQLEVLFEEYDLEIIRLKKVVLSEKEAIHTLQKYDAKAIIWGGNFFRISQYQLHAEQRIKPDVSWG